MGAGSLPAGRFVIQPQFDWANSFSEGLAAVQTSDKQWGYIDKSGAFMIPPQFHRAKEFSEGLAAVEVERKPGSWVFKFGYIDQTGHLVIPAQWDNAGRFSNGRAQVNITGMPDQVGYIDRRGKYIERPRVRR